MDAEKKVTTLSIVVRNKISKILRRKSKLQVYILARFNVFYISVCVWVCVHVCSCICVCATLESENRVQFQFEFHSASGRCSWKWIYLWTSIVFGAVSFSSCGQLLVDNSPRSTHSSIRPACFHLRSDQAIIQRFNNGGRRNYKTCGWRL